jgi:hypothetical protein
VTRFSRVLVLVGLLAVMLLAPAAARADFGIEPGSFHTSFETSEGVVGVPQASSHPYSFSLGFKLNVNSVSRSEGGELRSVLVDLPPGFAGDPFATGRCTRQEFEGFQPDCPNNSQIGIIKADLPGIPALATGALYDLVPPPGVAAQLGFSVTGLNALPEISVLSENPFSSGRYGLHVANYGLPLEATSIEVTVWGTPADSGHDSLRGPEAAEGKAGNGHAYEGPHEAFLTLPAECSEPIRTTLEVDSKLDPGNYVKAEAQSLDASGTPTAPQGCGAVPFSPKVSAATSSRAASAPSGLDFELGLPNEGLTDPDGIAETEPEKVEVELPRGVTANPSTAAGLSACSERQFEEASTTSPGCPESSKLGTLFARSPLIEQPVEGSVYLATPQANPFGTLLSLYIVAAAPERGVLIRQAGRVDINQETGQLTTTFDGLPPLPYSSFQLSLREGSRAPLTTPTGCGTFQATARLYPFSDPGTATVRTAPFTISSGAEGGGCVGSESQLPNAPTFEAGTQTPLAGAFSQFVLKLSRGDGSQRLGSIKATLPEGLLGKLAGVPFCSDAEIATATARSGEGQGALEQSSPSCPEASQVGVVNITAGAGAQPYPVQGKAYLAGPYKNAPFSLAIVTPAIAGPFDLGAVVVRVALYIDPNTAQISAISDPLPTILDGIPLDIRSVSLNMNRAGFTFNPTSCEPLSVTGQAISTTGQTATLSNRFQVGGCAGLAFKPSLSASTQGKASKANGASLVVKIAAKPGEANIRKVNLQLPVTLPSRLTTLQKACTEAKFNANPATCPADSVIGSATAHTPLLQAPLSGPAYLVSHGNAAFPDVEFVLQADERGGDVEIVLDGGTQIKKGITYSNFETVPDAPISSFETVLPTGPHSILTANLPSADNYNLCGQALQMPTTLTGQNGAVVKQSTPIAVTGCAPAIRVTKHTVKGTAATLVVSVPSAGRLTAKGAGLTSATKTVSAAKSVTLKVKLNKKQQASLTRHRGRKLKLRVKLQFAPKKGARLSTTATVLIG